MGEPSRPARSSYGNLEAVSPSLRKEKIQVDDRLGMDKRRMEMETDVHKGIIAHLERECGGNVHNRHVVDVTCGSFGNKT
jgi:hypothetical protein